MSVGSAPYLLITCHLLGSTFIPFVAIIQHASLSWEGKKIQTASEENPAVLSFKQRTPHHTQGTVKCVITELLICTRKIRGI